jgi:hypothetical protein
MFQNGMGRFLILAMGVVWMAGCSGGGVGLCSEPHSISQYKASSKTYQWRHPDWLIQNISIARVENESLGLQKRLDSLALFAYIGEPTPRELRELRTVASRTTTPNKLREAIRAYLDQAHDKSMNEDEPSSQERAGENEANESSATRSLSMRPRGDSGL